MIKLFLDFYHAHPGWTAIILYSIFSNLVSALPTPAGQTGFYRFFFDFMHGLGSNIGRIVATRNGNGISMAGKLGMLFLVVAVFSLAGCAVLHKKPLEVQAYRTIVGSKGFLDSEKARHPECATGAKTDLCSYLSRATAAKDVLIDTTEIYCSGPDFESGGPCQPPTDRTQKDQLGNKVRAAIKYYDQVESDLRKAK